MNKCFMTKSNNSLNAKREMRKLLPSFAILDFSPFVLEMRVFDADPDLVLVDRNYGMWVVVEVELETHSLAHHVLPQVQTFVTGRYDDAHARNIHDKDTNLNFDHLCNLISYTQPVVAVWVNSRSVLDKGWAVLETEYSVPLTFVESFIAEDGDVIVAVSGYLPVRPSRSIMRLRKHRMMNALVCDRPSDLPAQVDEEMRIYVGDRPYSWAVLRTMDIVVLLVPSGFMVRADRNYEVFEVEEGKYRLRQL